MQKATSRPLRAGCRIAKIFGWVGSLAGCPMMMSETPHSPHIIECRYPGQEYHAALDFNTTCWPDAQSRLMMHGKIPPEGGSMVAQVEIEQGPARSFQAQLHYDSCQLALEDVASGVACDFVMPIHAGQQTCRGPTDAPLNCSVSLTPPPGTTR